MQKSEGEKFSSIVIDLMASIRTKTTDVSITYEDLFWKIVRGIKWDIIALTLLWTNTSRIHSKQQRESRENFST